MPHSENDLNSTRALSDGSIEENTTPQRNPNWKNPFDKRSTHTPPTKNDNDQKRASINSSEAASDKKTNIPQYIPPQLSQNEDEIFGQEIGTGVNFDKYSDIPINVTGSNVAKPLSTFKDCELWPRLMQNIVKCNYSKLTPIQQHAIPNLVNGRDVMGCAQTGSGKTAAFLVPIIDTLLKFEQPMESCRPHVVIVTPTRELAIQVRNCC